MLAYWLKLSKMQIQFFNTVGAYGETKSSRQQGFSE